MSGFLDVDLDIDLDANSESDKWLTQRVSPPGGAGLTLRWGGEVVLFRQGIAMPIPPLAFTGPLSVAGVTGCRGKLRMFSIVFTATGAHALFGLDMQQFADTTVDATSVLGAWVSTLGSALSTAASQDERRAVATAALTPFTVAARATPISAPFAACIAAQPQRSLPDIAASLDVHERTLRRHCLREIGLSPKVFARALRFAEAQAFLEQDPNRSWADAVQRFGFADQAHLVREFRHFAGQPPTRIGEQDRAYDPVRVRNLQDSATLGV